MAERIADHDIENPRIRQFALDCRAVGSTPEEILQAAGIHRSAWFRWRKGRFTPTLKTWDRAQAALTSARKQRGDGEPQQEAAA